MSTSGTLSNCYVDAIMGQESEDVYGARFLQAPHMVTPRPSGAGDNVDFASCNFAPKSAVFPSSWSSVHPQGLYHPYVHHHHHHQSHLPTSDGRYGGVRSWMEPISGHVSFAGLHSSGRPYGTKPEVLPPKARECDTLEAEARPLPGEFACGVSECPEKARKEHSGSELSSHNEHKDDKQQLDPSK